MIKLTYNKLFNSNQGKIKPSVLIVGLFILLFFVIVIIVTTPTSKKTVLSTTTGIASTTPTATSTVNTSPSPATIVPAPIPPSSLAQNTKHAVGIAAGGGLSKIPAAALDQELDQMNTLGVKWIRFDIEWGDVEYNQGTFTWSAYDALINAAVAHHLNILVTILFTPTWARTTTCGGGAKCPPADPAQYATFAAQIAARYKGKVQAYEIWNEPNNYDFWATKTDCDAYTTLLKTTYPAIKQADPNAIVITGGLAPEATDNNNVSQMDFLSCIYKDGGKNYFDAVGDHPYTFPASPSSNNSNIWAQMSETTPSLRSIMTANGDAEKKIWITEYGAPTDGPDPHWYVTEAQQSAMVTDAMNLYTSYSWTGPIFWYTLEDGGTSTSTSENFFGLEHVDGSPKPAFTTLQNIISAGL